LECFSPEFRERHIEAPHTGSLVAVHTFCLGVLKGVGKGQPEDRHRLPRALRLGPGSTPTSRPPVTAVQLVDSDVLPAFDAHGATIDAALSDHGREFCGRPTASLRAVPAAREHRAQDHGPAGRRATASARAYTAPRSTSTSASRADAPGRDHLRCSMTTSTAAITAGRTKPRHGWSYARPGLP
jgi:hypothetical protein